MKQTITNREEWLNLALVEIRARFKDIGVEVPADARVSCGFPGGGSARKRVGECWPRALSSIGVNELFVSPVVRDQHQMIDILVHECVHAADDCKSGHKGFFRKTAKAIGLEGKMTSTHAGPELSAWIKATIEKLPVLEYGSLSLAGRTKKATYMLKLECDGCGMIVRTTQQWLDNVGCPTCACGGSFGEAG